MIETPRLVLRRWREEDREPFAAMGRDPEVMRFFPALLSRAESDRMIDERIAPHLDRHGFGLWAVERREDGAFLGFTGLSTVDHPCPIEGRSRAVMERLGMARAPGLDFEHSRVPEGSPLRPHLVYAIEPPWRS